MQMLKILIVPSYSESFFTVEKRILHHLLYSHWVLLEAQERSDKNGRNLILTRIRGWEDKRFNNSSWSKSLQMSERWAATSQLSSSLPTFQEHLWWFAHDYFPLQSRHASCITLCRSWFRLIPVAIIDFSQIRIVSFELSCSHLGESRRCFRWQLVVS